MRTTLALSTLAVAVGFAAVPVFAQTAGQPSSPMPGMSMTSPAQPGAQPQASGGCACCQRMAMMQPQTPPAPPKPQ